MAEETVDQGQQAAAGDGAAASITPEDRAPTGLEADYGAAAAALLAEQSTDGTGEDAQEGTTGGEPAPQDAAADGEQEQQEPKTADAAERRRGAEERLARKRDFRALKTERDDLKRRDDRMQELFRLAKQDPEEFRARVFREAGITEDHWREQILGKRDPSPADEAKRLLDEAKRERDDARKERQEIAARAEEAETRSAVMTKFDRVAAERWPLVNASSSKDEVWESVKSVYKDHLKATGEQLTMDDICDWLESDLQKRYAPVLKDQAVRRKLGLADEKIQPSKGANRRPATLTNDTIASPSGAKQGDLSLDDFIRQEAERVLRS